MSVMRSVFSANQLPMRGFVRPHPFWFVRYKDQWEGRPIDDNMTPHGLENGRVNCYRNSAWQALMSVPAFCNWLQRNHGPPLSGNGSKCSKKDCSGCQMYKVFDEIYPDKSHGIHSPDAQIDILRAVDNYFSETDLGTVQKWEKTWTSLGTIIGKRNRQEDAAEYLNFMQEAVGKRVMHRAKKEFRNMFQLKSKVTCECALILNENGKYPTSTAEEFMVYVNLPNDVRPWTIQTHFAETYSRCPLCSRASGNGIERYRISDVPNALFIQINSSGANSKRTEDIEFPEYLELTPYLSQGRLPGDNTALYRLSSIIWHIGSGTSGHITALVRGPTERWTYVNDSQSETFDTIEDFLVARMGRASGAGWNAEILTYVKAMDTYRPPTVESDEEDIGGTRNPSPEKPSPVKPKFPSETKSGKQPTVESDEDETSKSLDTPPPGKREGKSREQREFWRQETQWLAEEFRNDEEFRNGEERRWEEARSWHERQEQRKRSQQRLQEEAARRGELPRWRELEREEKRQWESIRMANLDRRFECEREESLRRQHEERKEKALFHGGSEPTLNFASRPSPPRRPAGNPPRPARAMSEYGDGEGNSNDRYSSQKGAPSTSQGIALPNYLVRGTS